MALKLVLSVTLLLAASAGISRDKLPQAVGARPVPEVERIQTRARIAALTFDGGGDAGGAPLILATLRRSHVPATFFVTGAWVRKFPQLARRIGRRYPVGNHTYDHADQTHLSSVEVRKEIRLGAWWIHAGTGRNPRPLFRFPYGARDSRTLEIVRSMGYASVRWSIDTWGWMGRAEGQSTSSVLRRVESQLAPGAIVLMHLGIAKDGSFLDAQALPAVISAVERHGYRFATLDRYVHAPR